MTRDVDLVLISQSEVVNYEEYAKLPLDRIDLFQEIVFPRMAYYQNAFHSHADLINMLKKGISFQDAPYETRRRLLSVWNLPALGCMHLANYLLGQGFQTCVINNADAEWDRFCETYRTCHKPPLVGISSTFHLGFAELRRITGKIHDLDPDSEIVVGGAFVNGLTQSESVERLEKTMRRYGIDYILYGFNSEVDLRDLLRKRNNGSIGEVANLAYFDRKNGIRGKFRTTQPHWREPVLDGTPALWDQLDLPFISHTVQMRTSCGCPFSCAFCSYPKVARGFRKTDLGVLEKSVQSVLRIPGVNRIVFVDDTLNVPPSRFKELCRLFSKYDFEWHSFLRVQFVDNETVELMRDSGCRAVYLGIESANDQVLLNMNKRATRMDYERGINLLGKYGITSVAAFVIGFPGETEQTIRENQDFIETSGVEFFTLKEFYYMEHASIHAERERYGLAGMGNKWSHATMDSQTAYEHKIMIFKEVKNSCFIDPDTSLWHLILLLDAGFTLCQIKAIQQETNAIIRDQLNGSFDDDHEAIGRLRKMLVEQGQCE
jgi:radical SAM superfamily enzyme YgiQ (UPF0313 family)